MFRQSKAAWPTSGNWNFNVDNPAANLFSDLADLGQYRGGDGKLEFKMVYPLRSGKNFNQWKQSTDPVKTLGAVQGYEAVDITFHKDDTHPNAFGGLQASQAKNVLLHNYDPAFPTRFWYAMGVQSPQYPEWPGADGSWKEEAVELYVKDKAPR